MTICNHQNKTFIKSLIIDRLKDFLEDDTDIFVSQCVECKKDFFGINSLGTIVKGEVNEENKELIKNFLLGIDSIGNKVLKEVAKLIEGNFETLDFEVKLFFRLYETHIDNNIDTPLTLDNIFPSVNRIIIYQKQLDNSRKIICYSPYIEEIQEYLQISK